MCAVDFEAFQRVLNRPGGFRDPGEPEEYCRGFQVFDKDMTGFIGVGQLKYILTNLGEKMTDEEVDELLKAVDTSSGQVNYTGMFCTLRHCLQWLIIFEQTSSELSSLTRRFLEAKCACICGRDGVGYFCLITGPGLGTITRNGLQRNGGTLCMDIRTASGRYLA